MLCQCLHIIAPRGPFDTVSSVALLVCCHEAQSCMCDKEGRIFARVLNLRPSSVRPHPEEIVSKFSRLTLRQLSLDFSPGTRQDWIPLRLERLIALKDALSPHLSVVSLGLKHNRLGSVGLGPLMEKLASLKALRSLQLDLSCNGIMLKGVSSMAAALPEGLVYLGLCLEANKIGDDGAVALAKALPVLHNLECLELDLSSNKVGPSGARALASSLRSMQSLVRLNFTLLHNPIGTEARMVLKESTESIVSLREGAQAARV